MEDLVRGSDKRMFIAFVCSKEHEDFWRSYSTFGYFVSELAIESYRAPHRVLNAIFSHRTITSVVCNSPSSMHFLGV